MRLAATSTTSSAAAEAGTSRDTDIAQRMRAVTGHLGSGGRLGATARVAIGRTARVEPVRGARYTERLPRSVR